MKTGKAAGFSRAIRPTAIHVSATEVSFFGKVEESTSAAKPQIKGEISRPD